LGTEQPGKKYKGPEAHLVYWETRRQRIRTLRGRREEIKYPALVK
jgi:hypothetical protein